MGTNRLYKEEKMNITFLVVWCSKDGQTLIKQEVQNVTLEMLTKYMDESSMIIIERRNDGWELDLYGKE